MPLFVRAGSIIPVGPDIQFTGDQPDAPIELWVYPGQDGEFTLYEDEGDNYNYEAGEFRHDSPHLEGQRPPTDSRRAPGQLSRDAGIQECFEWLSRATSHLTPWQHKQRARERFAMKDSELWSSFERLAMMPTPTGPQRGFAARCSTLSSYLYLRWHVP